MTEHEDHPLRAALRRIGGNEVLSADAAGAAFGQIMDGAANQIDVAAFLTALHFRGETAQELLGAVRAVRERMRPLEVPGHLRPLIDTCGTGGDGRATFNISTAAAIVVAATGARVAKHGNRAASGVSGSAEVLVELGVRTDAPDPVLIRCLGEVGITFLYAPAFHPAMRHAAEVRRQLPFATLFNLVGPLANPARPEFQFIGTPTAEAARRIGLCLLELLGEGASWPQRAAVCFNGDSLDEVSLTSFNQIQFVDPNSLGYYREKHQLLSEIWQPEHSGLSARPRWQELQVTGPRASADCIRTILSGASGPSREIVLANAAAALVVAEKGLTWQSGVSKAAEAIDSGAANRVLERWATLSHSVD